MCILRQFAEPSQMQQLCCRRLFQDKALYVRRHDGLKLCRTLALRGSREAGTTMSHLVDSTLESNFLVKCQCSCLDLDMKLNWGGLVLNGLRSICEVSSQCIYIYIFVKPIVIIVFVCKCLLLRLLSCRRRPVWQSLHCC